MSCRDLRCATCVIAGQYATSHCKPLLFWFHGPVIGRIHGAIVAATVGAIVAATMACSIHEATVAAIVAAIVAATITATFAATIAPTGCGDDRPVYTPYKKLLIDSLSHCMTYVPQVDLGADKDDGSSRTEVTHLGDPL